MTVREVADVAADAGKQYVREARLNNYWGMRLFLLQRITGVGIVFYLFTHMMVIGSIAGGAGSFDRMLARMTDPPWFFLPLEFVLMLALLFHALNGIRVTVLEFGGLARHHKASVALMAAVGLALAFAGGALFYSYIMKAYAA